MKLLSYQLNRIKRFVSRFGNIHNYFKYIKKNLVLRSLPQILANWEIGRINSRKFLRGGASSNWMVETTSGKYVLRNVGTNRDYIEFQIFIINKLVECNFPYSVPQFLKTKGAYCVRHLNNFWVLYKFIEGDHLRTKSDVQAKEIGRLVTSYHKIAQRIDYSHMSNFSLSLFETETVNSIFRESTDSIGVKKTRNNYLEDLLIKSVNPILEAYNSIPIVDKDSIENLEKIPVYNDWHADNILSMNEKIIGLVDFDSLVVAPRIVDIQNGLLYAAGTNEGINITMMQAFIQGYCSVLPLSKSELSLTFSLMIERIASIVSDILVEKRIKRITYKDDVLIFLINVLNWIISNKEKFIYHLFAATGAND